MFIIAKKSDFDKDFDEYLSRRLNKGDNANFFFKTVDSLIPKRNKKDVQEMPEIKSDEMSEYGGIKKRSFLSKVFKRFYASKNNKDEVVQIEDELPEDVKEEVEDIEDDVEAVDEIVEDLEDKRDGLLRRLFKRMFGIKDREVEDEDYVDPDLVKETIESAESELKEDTRIVLKSIHKWLSRLPPDHIEAFRRSPDFVRYKDLLEKYGLIRNE